MAKYEINKNDRADATLGWSPVQKMFRDRTEAMLDQSGTGPGSGPILTLLVIALISDVVCLPHIVQFELTLQCASDLQRFFSYKLMFLCMQQIINTF